MTAPARSRPDRESVAERLLRGSAAHSYDPVVDIDWERPLDRALPAFPLHRVTLCGTPLWDEMTDDQRVQLSWHEFASTARVGLWFELILMQMLLRQSYDQDPESRYVQYALVEVGDETRHSVMFARAAALLAPGNDYGPSRLVHELGRLFKTTASGPAMFASVLVAEETLDRGQREMMDDPGLLPLAREVSRIHVTEEARHVSYARDAVARQVPALSRPQLVHARVLTAVAAQLIVDAMIDPAVYAAVGLDPVRAVAEARRNEQRRETRLWSAEKVTGFLTGVGLIDGPSTTLWRRAGLVR